MKRFFSNQKGNTSLIFGLSMIPLIAAGTMAVDFGNGHRIRTSLQAAADAAVLAAATSMASGNTNFDKKKIAENTFHANIDAKMRSSFVATPRTYIDFPVRKVYMKVDVETQDLMSRLLTDKLALSVDATAVVDNGIPICMMSLNPSAEKSLAVNGTADVAAQGCAVQVNSTHAEALSQVGAGTATADHFCVTGGYTGSNFTPQPERNCLVEKDPLATKMAAAWASVSTACTKSNKTTINSNGTTNLAPGVYCNGFEVKKGTVQLQQGGTYVFKNGEFSISSQGGLQGEEVTILLYGSDTRIKVQGGGDLDISAKKSGLFSGIAIAQHSLSTTPNSNKQNLVTGGGTVEINGVIYFPKQHLDIRGNGIIGQTADQFAVIADTIDVRGNGKLTIKIGADYQAAGLPELPESKERVRLVN